MKTNAQKIRIILIGVFVAAATLFTRAQDMTVVIKNVKGTGGSLRVKLYKSADQFMNVDYQAAEINATNGEVVTVLKDVKPGIYAISIIHDANSNKKLDSNMFGIPKEGFGFSNDAMGTFGPPDFKKASFEFSENDPVVITMKYM